MYGGFDIILFVIGWGFGVVDIGNGVFVESYEDIVKLMVCFDVVCEMEGIGLGLVLVCVVVDWYGVNFVLLEN